MINLKPEWFPFLKPAVFQKLAHLLLDPPKDLMPHQLAVMLGINIPSAVLIITVLSTKNISKSYLLIYHACDTEVPYGKIDFGIGFPPLPWTCPNCEETVIDYSELSFDLITKISL